MIKSRKQKIRLFQNRPNGITANHPNVITPLRESGAVKVPQSSQANFTNSNSAPIHSFHQLTNFQQKKKKIKKKFKKKFKKFKKNLKNFKKNYKKL